MQANIRLEIIKLYLLQAFRWAMFYMPIFVLFLQANDLTLNQIFWLQTIFSAVIVLFEIPSGYLADKLGKKHTMVIGSILSFLGALSYIASQSFFGFLTAEILLGIGISFTSGADSALIYENLKSIKQESLYKKIEAKMQIVSSSSESIASFLGGFLALISLRTTFLPYAFLMLASIFIALSLKEPPQQDQTQSQATPNHFKELIRIIKYSLHGHPQIAALLFYSGIINASTLIMVFLIQPYLQAINVPLAYFGILWAILNLSIAFFSLFIIKYENRLGTSTSLKSLLIYPILGFFLLSFTNSYFGIILIFLFYFTRAISNPIFKDYVNYRVDPNIRATVLSVKHLISRLVFVILAPIIGYLTKIQTLQQTFLVCAIIFSICGLLTLTNLHHKHKVT